MGRDIADYVALALVADLTDEDDWYSNSSSEFSGDLDQLKAKAFKVLGFPVSDYVLQQATRALAECGLIRVTDDNFSGTFVKVRSKGFSEFISQAQSEFAKAREDEDEISIITKPSDYPRASALAKHELFDDYHELGAEWLKRALEGLRKRVEEAGSLDALRTRTDLDVAEAPASDRIVSFSDNQVIELDTQTGEVIDVIAAQNQIDDEPGLREIVLGQLKAGRELIRAGSFRLYFLELTLIETLKFLAKRYEREAIGGLASALIAALLKHIGIKD